MKDLVSQSGGEGGDEAVRKLVEMDKWVALRDSARDANPVVRKRAIEGLIQILLCSSNPSARACSAEALGVIGDACAVDALLRVLSDPDGVVRAESTWALVKIGDVRAVDGLLRALSHPDESVRSLAARALGELE